MADNIKASGIIERTSQAFEVEESAAAKANGKKGKARVRQGSVDHTSNPSFETENTDDDEETTSQPVTGFSRQLLAKSLEEADDRDERDTVWREIFMMLEDPESGPVANAIGMLIMAMIFVSSVGFVIDTQQSVKDNAELNSFLKTAETVCIISFTVEYVVRVSLCWSRPTENPSIIKYILKPMNLVDLFAIAPFYIELILAGDVGLAFLRMLRMTRIFRVLKIFVDGMARAKEGLLLLGFLMLLYLCVFGTILHMLEYDAQACPDIPEPVGDEPDPCYMRPRRGFTSIPTTWYFILATITTVGYGDHFPITLGGKLCTMVCMFCGILVLGLPMVVIGVSFDDAFKNAALFKKAKKEKLLAKRAAGGMVMPVELQEETPESAQIAEEQMELDYKSDAKALQIAGVLEFLFVQTGDERFDDARYELTLKRDPPPST